jgi:hypothetical protein
MKDHALLLLTLLKCMILFNKYEAVRKYEASFVPYFFTIKFHSKKLKQYLSKANHKYIRGNDGKLNSYRFLSLEKL